MTEKKRRMLWALFCLYCAVMLWLLFAREEATGDLSYWEQMRLRINLTPFHTIFKQLRRLVRFHEPWGVRHSFVNLGGNVLLFVPLGMFLPLLWKRLRKLWRVLLATAMIIALVEAMQVLTLLGRCDVDDVILNVLGAAMGYGVYKLMEKKTDLS